MTFHSDKHIRFPVLPLRNVVLLPKAILPVKVSRAVSIAAVNKSIDSHRGEIFVTFQSDPGSEELIVSDLSKVGVVAKILQSVSEKDGSLKILVEGLYRANTNKFELEDWEKTELYFANCTNFLSKNISDKAIAEGYLRNIKAAFKEFCMVDEQKNSSTALKAVKEAADLENLLDITVLNIDLKEEEKKEFLEEASMLKRAKQIYSYLQNEIEIVKAEKNIRKRVQSQVEKHQKDYYLNEQVRAIYKELGREDFLIEVEKFKQQAKKLKMSADALEKLLNECKRLEQMQPTSPEATVSRGYIEWLLALPWHNQSKDQISLEAAEKILESSHFGMQKAKEAILDFIAAKKFAKEKLKKSPIICLMGPPGVGKTSLASSIAKALGREFIRISLGGLKDEAEIRGHRKTYIGSMPGKIISAMRKAKVINPVILLDEIDKMSTDFRGDPSASLLEVLDPEQNKGFTDHFLETEYDLSKVIFIATANMLENIPYPLLDRMEVISLTGYTEEEKLKIAEKFLLPTIIEEHNIENSQINFKAESIKMIISEYTREAGVRQLNRSLLKVVRKSIHLLLDKKTKRVEISEDLVEKWLGNAKYKNSLLSGCTVGVATGLAWTEVGGDILEVEVVKLKGKGALTITGQLGEVMQESAQASLSFIRSRAKDLGLKEDFYSNCDLHIHLPEGATPKDGPSAGITMTTALVSVLTNIAVDRSVAMSGEVTLQGRVLPVGGLKEKILAAIRHDIKKVLVPKENESDVKEFSKEIDGKIIVDFVENMDQVLSLSLAKNPLEKNGSSSDNEQKKEKNDSKKKESKSKKRDAKRITKPAMKKQKKTRKAKRK